MRNEKAPLSKEQRNAVETSIGKRAKEIEDAFTNAMIHSAPVFHCADELRKSIDEILITIESNQIEDAADLGYGDLCSNFVWMQRCLGALHDAALKRSNAISEVAGDCGLAYEQVKPLVVEYIDRINSQKQKQSNDDERKNRIDEMLANFRHTQPPR
jgi:hypothetical protein